MSEILNMLSYHFMQRALIVGVLVSLCAALLGVSLVLSRPRWGLRRWRWPCRS